MRSCIAILSILAVCASASANLLSNGDFEAQTFAAPYQTLTGTQLVGWNIIGANVAGIRQPYLGSVTQEIDLSGVADTTPGTTGISQTVATTIGQRYFLSFDVYAGQTATNPYQGGVDLAINGASVFSNLQGDRTTFGYSFVASSASTTFDFMSSRGNVSHIDNVTLATPAPGAVVSFALGALRLRRRRK